mmetsp:Transcript_16354/g.37349  ORF Transcript_16354/g.37349 Transcript_16354/m.37349 type:complete len:809 (-) Transcript_16354:65-2491(-)
MKPSELVDRCIECYKSFQPNKMTLDSHLELFLAQIDCSDEGDAIFIKQVVYGCMRYKKLIKVLLTALYFKHGTEVSREDYNLYMVFAYITLIRLEDMSVSIFRRFVFAQDAQKMFVFLSFIFNAQTLNKWMKEEWCRLYDEQFVEDELIAKLLRNLPEVSDIIERLRELASTKDEDDIGEGDKVKRQLPTTKVEPFNLSKPRPRMLPEPFAIKLENPYKKPIPESVKNPEGDGTLKKVEEARKKAREETLSKHSKSKGPDLEIEKLSSKKVVRAGKYKDALAQEHERLLEEQTRFIPPQPTNPQPALKAAESSSIRLNTAAVLREDALFRKKQQEEAALIKKYESELRDDSEYYEWQARMRQEDELRRLQEIEHRRIQMILTDQNAKEARIQNERENQKFAADMRKEAEAFREMSRAEREQLLQEKRLLVDDVKAAEKNVKPAIEAVLEAKTMLGIELREESKRLEEEAKAKRAKEEEERMEIVRQIRALESVPVDRTVQFDPTSVSDSSRHVLEAMSMAELLERLEMVKQQAKELEDEKRKEIILSKQAREDDLISRVQTIHKVREIRKKDAREQRMRKLKKAEEEKELRLRLRNEAQLKLQEEIEMKRKARIEEDEMLRKEMEMIEIKKQFLAAGAAQMEEKKFRDLEAGAERKLRDRQARERLEHQAYLASMQEEEKNRKKVLKLREKTRKELVREYDERVREGVAAMVDALATTHAEKRRVVEQTRDFESTLKDKQIVSDPNKHMTNVKSILSARNLRSSHLKGSLVPSRSSVRDDLAERSTGHIELGRSFRGLPYRTEEVSVS